MTEPVLLPSPEWEKRLGIKVHDPDGWRGRIPQAKDFDEPISEEEFRQRAMVSTIERIAPERADRDQPEFRVGGKQPGNLYRNNKRFGFVLRDEDGPLVAAVLNAYMEGREPDLGPLLAVKDAEIERLRADRDEVLEIAKSEADMVRWQRDEARAQIAKLTCDGSSGCEALMHVDGCFAQTVAEQEANEPSRSRTLTVAWHPDAIRSAVDRALAVLDSTPDVEAFKVGNAHLTQLDLMALIDAGRQFLADDEPAVPSGGDPDA